MTWIETTGYARSPLGFVNNKNGYRYVPYSDVATQEQKCDTAHRLVVAWNSRLPLSSNLHVHHRDENKLNNYLPNLVLVTAKEHNALHYAELWREGKKAPKGRRKKAEIESPAAPEPDTFWDDYGIAVLLGMPECSTGSLWS